MFTVLLMASSLSWALQNFFHFEIGKTVVLYTATLIKETIMYTGKLEIHWRPKNKNNPLLVLLAYYKYKLLNRRGLDALVQSKDLP
jgi:hypothetical protein